MLALTQTLPAAQGATGLDRRNPRADTFRGVTGSPRPWDLVEGPFTGTEAAVMKPQGSEASQTLTGSPLSKALLGPPTHAVKAGPAPAC